MHHELVETLISDVPEAAEKLLSTCLSIKTT